MTPPDDLPPSLPPALARALAGAEWQAITIGMSGAQVYRVTEPEQPEQPKRPGRLGRPGWHARYLKVASGPRVAELRAERARLAWLAGRLPVPAVEGWVETSGSGADEPRAWLLLHEAPGLMACEPAALADPQRLVATLAQGLRRLHALPAADCPFDTRLDRRLAQAQWGIGQGIADEEAVQRDHGCDATALLRRLSATRPAEPTRDLVFTHGDYCLPNLLLDATYARVTAYLDFGRAGVADRHQDVAIGARSVRHNLGAAWGPHFLDAYGRDQLDDTRLAWYELLDELF